MILVRLKHIGLHQSFPLFANNAMLIDWFKTYTIGEKSSVLLENEDALEEVIRNWRNEIFRSTVHSNRAVMQHIDKDVFNAAIVLTYLKHEPVFGQHFDLEYTGQRVTDEFIHCDDQPAATTR